jgi:hypothetical protein
MQLRVGVFPFSSLLAYLFDQFGIVCRPISKNASGFYQRLSQFANLSSMSSRNACNLIIRYFRFIHISVG